MSTAASDTANAGRPAASGVRRVLIASAPGRGPILLVAGIIAALLVILDQVTKNWAEANLAEHTSEPLLGRLLQLRLLYNSGAAWGMGSEITPVVTGLQIAISLAVVVFLFRSVRTWTWMAALALVLGGALGNIHDRLLRPPGFFHGHVVDFLQLPNWPIFNVADMAVVAGAIAVVLLSLLGVDTAPHPEESAGEGSAA